MAGDRSEAAVSYFEVRRGSERNFGLVFAGFFAVLFLLGLWKGSGTTWLWAGLSVVMAGLAVFAPGVLRRPNKAWHTFGMLLGRIVGPIVMVTLFFAVVTPLAVLMRLFGKDPLRLRWDRSAKTYWIDRTPPGPPPDSMPLQF